MEVPPFFLTIIVFSKNLYNYLVISGASANVMPLGVCTKLGISPAKSDKRVVQLDKSEVKVVSELLNVHMQIVSKPRVQHFMDIQVVNIPNAYNMLLSWNWSKSLNGYMATDFLHMWFP